MTTPTTQREADEQERELFEKHFGPRDSFAWRNEDGTYKVGALQSAWKIWQARASLTPTAPQAADWQNVMQQRLYDLRKDVSTACQLLADNEWAEHFATTPEGRVLESAIAKLVGGAPQAATTASAAASQAAPEPRNFEISQVFAPVQAAQPALPAGFSITKAELGAIDIAMSHLVGSHELPVTTGILDTLLKRAWASLAAPGAAQTTVAREGGAK